MSPAAPHRPAKAIPSAERLIFALDVATAAEAKRLVQTLGDSVRFYKIGLELFTAEGAFELLDYLIAQGKKVFADFKLYDVPRTVGAAVRNLSARGATFVTVHGDRAIMDAACEEKGRLGILAVTVLTSLNEKDLADMGYAGDVGGLVLKRALTAKTAGCDGVVASGHEAALLRADLGPNMAIVVPGIRPPGPSSDDQKRTVDVEEAFQAGADYVVIGRPIRSASDPAAAAAAYQARIAKVCGA